MLYNRAQCVHRAVEAEGKRALVIPFSPHLHRPAPCIYFIQQIYLAHCPQYDAGRSSVLTNTEPTGILLLWEDLIACASTPEADLFAGQQT